LSHCVWSYIICLISYLIHKACTKMFPPNFISWKNHETLVSFLWYCNLSNPNELSVSHLMSEDLKKSHYLKDRKRKGSIGQQKRRSTSNMGYSRLIRNLEELLVLSSNSSPQGHFCFRPFCRISFSSPVEGLANQSASTASQRSHWPVQCQVSPIWSWSMYHSRRDYYAWKVVVPFSHFLVTSVNRESVAQFSFFFLKKKQKKEREENTQDNGRCCNV
jgi:hypothetical protein